MGRPKKNISEDQVIALAAINCSYAEMAAVLDCDESTLTKRFSQAIKKGRENGRMSLKRKQWDVAMSGNVTMLIWLGKQYLDQKDKKEFSGPDNGPIPVDTTSATLLDELKSLFNMRVNDRKL